MTRQFNLELTLTDNPDGSAAVTGTGTIPAPTAPPPPPPDPTPPPPDSSMGWHVIPFVAGADLGAQINAAIGAGETHLYVPPRQGRVIRTTVRGRQGVLVDFGPVSFVNRILCQTTGKPTFEFIGPSMREWRIRGGFFDGALVGTPSCLLQYGRPASGEQTGDNTPLAEMRTRGHWGIAVVINIAGEVARSKGCILGLEGKGDFKPTVGFPGPFPHATVINANADYWGLPFAYNAPTKAANSTSAMQFEGGAVGYDVPHPTDPQLPGPGSAFLFKGQVEDYDSGNVYINSIGRCGVLILGGAGSCVRHSYAGARFETNKGITWPGCPFLIADGEGVQNQGIYNLGLGSMSFFIHGSTVPVLKTERGGIIHTLTAAEGLRVEGTSVFLDHKTADLAFANLWLRNKVAIDVGTRSIVSSHIWSAGPVTGIIPAPGPRWSEVRANLEG